MNTVTFLKKWPIFCLWVIFSAIVVIWPQIDLLIAAIFYNPEEGFYLKNWGLAKWIYDVFAQKFAHYLGVLLLIWLFLFSPVAGHSVRRKRYRKYIVYWIICLVVGGILVEVVFKENWGRARPVNVEQFAGAYKFSPAYVIAKQEGKSFVSGHAAIGYSFLVLGFIMGKKRWFVPGLALGVVLSLTRIIQGGHFFSDVFLAGFFIYGVCYIFDRWFLHKNIKENEKGL